MNCETSSELRSRRRASGATQSGKINCPGGTGFPLERLYALAAGFFAREFTFVDDLVVSRVIAGLSSVTQCGLFFIPRGSPFSAEFFRRFFRVRYALHGWFVVGRFFLRGS